MFLAVLPVQTGSCVWVWKGTRLTWFEVGQLADPRPADLVGQPQNLVRTAGRRVERRRGGEGGEWRGEKEREGVELRGGRRGDA